MAQTSKRSYLKKKGTVICETHTSIIFKDKISKAHAHLSTAQRPEQTQHYCV